MARGDKITRGGGPRKASDAREQMMQAKLASGEVIQMITPWAGGLVVYVDNTPKAINRRLKMGFQHVEYEEEIVKKPKAKPRAATKKAADKPKG